MLVTPCLQACSYLLMYITLHAKTASITFNPVMGCIRNLASECVQYVLYIRMYGTYRMLSGAGGTIHGSVLPRPF